MAKTAKTDNPLAYALHSILTVRFNYILATKKFDDKNPDCVNYHINPIINFRVDHENIIVRVIVIAEIRETQEKILEIETVFAFKVKDLSEHVVSKQEEDGKISWAFKNPAHEGVIIPLISISYSTIRGIIFEKLRGTFLAEIPLPIIDPNTFIHKHK